LVGPLVFLVPSKSTAGSGEYDSKDPSGGYFVEFDDIADEYIRGPRWSSSTCEDGFPFHRFRPLGPLVLVCTQTYLLCFRCDDWCNVGACALWMIETCYLRSSESYLHYILIYISLCHRELLWYHLFPIGLCTMRVWLKYTNR
jgi:hypothetical protein